MFGRKPQKSLIEYPDWGKVQGTAAFTRRSDDLGFLFNAPHGANCIPLGLNEPGSTDGQLWNLSTMEGHGLCFAPNGTGKTASVVIPAALSYGGSMAIVDPKGEVAWATAAARRAMGQQVYILDPFGEVQRQYADKAGITERITNFNPFASISRLSRTFTDDCAAIAVGMIHSREVGDEHWPLSARAYVKGVVALLKEAFGPRATLQDLKELIKGPRSDLFLLSDAVKSKLPDSYGAETLERFRVGGKEVEGIISSALTQLQFLDSPDIQSGTKNDTVPLDLSDFTQRRMTIFLVLPPDKLETHGRWLRMVIALLLNAITRATVRPDPPCCLVVDEMGTIGSLKPVETAYSLFRSYGLRMFGFFQSYSQLVRDYPLSWSSFIENSAVVQVLGAQDQTAEYFSRRLGTVSLSPAQAPVNYLEMFHAPDPATYHMHRQQEMLNRPQQSRPVMYPHELSGLLARHSDPSVNTQLLMFKRGAENVLSLQNPYFSHPAWRGKYRPDPNRKR